MGAKHIIPNDGSEARDHLANERTYLAWVRTALGIVGLGVLIIKILDIDTLPATVGGLVMIALGGISLVYASYRYMRVARLLTEGRFPVARYGPMLLGAAMLVATLGGLAYVLLG